VTIDFIRSSTLHSGGGKSVGPFFYSFLLPMYSLETKLLVVGIILRLGVKIENIFIP